MTVELRGQVTVRDQRFAIVVSRFNEFVTAKLLAGALDALERHGTAAENITVVHVPGAFEIPLAAKKLADSLVYDAIICLGCVIRGETRHFEYIAAEAARGVAEVALSTGVPASFGVITADTMEQALDRAGDKGNNKGVEAALCAVEMADLLRKLPSGG
jgi:6,7-dimethyl-8-ribityllumazine synthase